MKKIILSITIALFSLAGFAQGKLVFPFKGGKEAMTQFFKDSTVISKELVAKKVSGVVILKFTADEKGNVTKTVVYYADDPDLVTPVADAIRKTGHKWIIYEHEKLHDFIIPFYIRFNIPDNGGDEALQKAEFENYRNKRPILPNNQIPLDMATLLPAVTVNYDLTL